MINFQDYVAAFSAAEYDRFSSYYTDDVVLELNAMPPIRGKDGIVGFYREMFARVRENVTSHALLADDHNIALDATCRFTAVADAPDFVVGALARGEYIEVRVFVFYELRDGLISYIRVGRGGAEGVPRFFAADGMPR